LSHSWLQHCDLGSHVSIVIRQDGSLQNSRLSHNLHVDATGGSDGTRPVQLLGNLRGNRSRCNARGIKANRVRRRNRDLAARANVLAIGHLILAVVAIVLAIRAAAKLSVLPPELARAKLPASALSIHAVLLSHSVLIGVDATVG